MCAQYNQTSSTHEISKRFNAKDFNSPPEFKQRMFPKYKGVVVYPENGSPILKVMEWGLLPHTAKDLTTEPAPAIAPIHSRMPLTIQERHYEPWLAGESDLEDLSLEAKALDFEVL